MKGIVILLLISPLFSSSQKQVELYLGDYFKAFITLPADWKEAPSLDNEKCFSKTDNSVSICVKSRSRNDRTLIKILEDYLNSISPVQCETKESKAENLQSVWKECRVAVGPRTEARIWTVISYKNTRNVIIVDVNLPEGINSTIQNELIKMLDGIKYVDPPQ